MPRTLPELPDDLLEEIGSLMSSEDMAEQDWWLDLEERQIVVIQPDVIRQSDETQLPDWQLKQRALARQIEADDTGRYLEIPVGRSRGRLHAFVRALSDPVLAEKARDAMQGGRGAYRRVRSLLHRLGREALWHQFEAEQNREDARRWLQDVCVVPDDEGEE